jgi:hypothetical protein
MKNADHRCCIHPRLDNFLFSLWACRFPPRVSKSLENYNTWYGIYDPRISSLCFRTVDLMIQCDFSMCSDSPDRKVTPGILLPCHVFLCVRLSLSDVLREQRTASRMPVATSLLASFTWTCWPTARGVSCFLWRRFCLVLCFVICVCHMWCVCVCVHGAIQLCMWMLFYGNASMLLSWLYSRLMLFKPSSLMIGWINIQSPEVFMLCTLSRTHQRRHVHTSCHACISYSASRGSDFCVCTLHIYIYMYIYEWVSES